MREDVGTRSIRLQRNEKPEFDPPKPDKPKAPQAPRTPPLTENAVCMAQAPGPDPSRCLQDGDGDGDGTGDRKRNFGTDSLLYSRAPHYFDFQKDAGAARFVRLRGDLGCVRNAGTDFAGRNRNGFTTRRRSTQCHGASTGYS